MQCKRPGRWFLQLDVMIPCAYIYIYTHIVARYRVQISTPPYVAGSPFCILGVVCVGAASKAIDRFHFIFIPLCCVDQAIEGASQKTPDGRAGVTGLLHLQKATTTSLPCMHAAASGQQGEGRYGVDDRQRRPRGGDGVFRCHAMVHCTRTRTQAASIMQCSACHKHTQIIERDELLS